jgi:hypothetical protein
MTSERKGVGQAVTRGVTIDTRPKLVPLHWWLLPSLGLECRLNSKRPATSLPLNQIFTVDTAQTVERSVVDPEWYPDILLLRPSHS